MLYGKNYDFTSLQDNNISLTIIVVIDIILNKLPPLIKGYLKASRMVRKDYYRNAEFETIDYCIIMLTNQISNRYQNNSYIYMCENV